ncbi:Crp/Fnr family transcriptional regulator [Spirosoma endophyticum]|uniref:cAMP-binding domain of CRP or a regulatory subunit of cAMP-dependent protein kinases n=1 Tax=Spirosoma endophyticum TaxID=662367 RepID=A0A1I1QKX6_9BACT|nr:Crp/Fnr family transcriptional regulator [Spirosoma endophyticum]SFD22642.1 cAMP-binding domain of CRP or a regulatory subunit of cAMP-dependent protein kinases [Spirosoma endophyticum]
MHPALQTYLAGKITLSAEEASVVSSYFKVKYTKRNEILVAKGSVARYVYFVVKGCLRVFLTDDQGNESTRFLVLEGRFGTTFPSFILRQPSIASLQSPESSELLMISYEDRQALYTRIPGWETMDRIGLELDYIESIRRIESFISLDARARYDTLQQTNPEIIQRLPAKIIADYLGISQETLSRLKTKR